MPVGKLSTLVRWAPIDKLATVFRIILEHHRLEYPEPDNLALVGRFRALESVRLIPDKNPVKESGKIMRFHEDSL